MDADNWKNISDIFKNSIKKERSMDEVSLDQLLSLELEERLRMLLAEYTPYEERTEEGQGPEET